MTALFDSFKVIKQEQGNQIMKYPNHYDTLELTMDHAMQGYDVESNGKAVINDLLAIPYIKAQLDSLGANRIKKQLKIEGDYTEAELSDPEENKRMFVFFACCDIVEFTSCTTH